MSIYWKKTFGWNGSAKGETDKSSIITKLIKSKGREWDKYGKEREEQKCAWGSKNSLGFKWANGRRLEEYKTKRK